MKAAKAAQREKESSASSSNVANSNKKRPMDGITTSPTAGSSSSNSKPLKRDTRLIGTYFEYDLSKMVNSKGGFLLEDNKEVDEELRRKEKERERERAMRNLDPRTSNGFLELTPRTDHSYSCVP